MKGNKGCYATIETGTKPHFSASESGAERNSSDKNL